MKRRCFRLRFLHLSDLHLGKRVCEFSMLDDQRYILVFFLFLLARFTNFIYICQ